MRIGVAIATLGRPLEAAQLVRQLARQTARPDVIVLSVTKPEDVGDLASEPGVQIVYGEPGLCRQRNRALEVLFGRTDIVVFFDDDYLPSIFALERMGEVFARYPDVVGATGRLLADGINSSGISYEAALELIEDYDARPTPDMEIRAQLQGLYGCNMAYRTSAIGEERFDENLPLYGWQEDIDFAARLLPRGGLVKTHAFAGVHRGVKGARSSGVRFGYMQVINPIYMARKGTMQPGYAAKVLLRNLLANHMKMFRPESWVDRAGRARGNWIALADVARARIDPRRVLML
jgi:GT2 family glycosyltransferase